MELHSNLIGACLVQVRKVEVNGKTHKRLAINCDRDLPRSVARIVENMASTVEGFELLFHGRRGHLNEIEIIFTGGQRFIERLTSTINYMSSCMSIDDIESAWGSTSNSDVWSAMAVFAHTGHGLDRKTDADDL